MKNIRIENSYNTWGMDNMFAKITDTCKEAYGSYLADKLLNRSYYGMYVEWWLHNIGYFMTLPFLKHDYIKRLNERFKHVDLEEHI